MRNLFKQDVLVEQLTSIHKYNQASWFKKLFFSFMGGVFIALGFVGYLVIFVNMKVTQGSIRIDGLYHWIPENSALRLFLSTIIFPIGMIMCLFIGGYLFSSGAMLILPMLRYKIKWYQFILQMSLIYFMNVLGCIVIASIILGTKLFSNNETHAQILINLVKDTKLNTSWWQNFLSAILCNLLVCVAVFGFYTCNSKGVGAFVVYVCIYLFVLCGYNHIVANFYVISLAGFIACTKGWNWTNEEIGKIFYHNLIPVTLGNTIGGMFVPIMYYLSEIKFKTK